MLDLTNICLSFLICGSTMLSVIAIRYNGRRSGSLKQKYSWVTSIVFCVCYCSTTFFTLFFFSPLNSWGTMAGQSSEKSLWLMYLWWFKPHLGVWVSKVKWETQMWILTVPKRGQLQFWISPQLLATCLQKRACIKYTAATDGTVKNNIWERKIIKLGEGNFHG